jgi:hypothetical protein
MSPFKKNNRTLNEDSNMGLYHLAEKLLPERFSIYQFMAVLDMDKEDAREARNILHQFYQRGYIKRISKNLYIKAKKNSK